jgi:putative ABC transport system substrate-binding protein
MFEMRRRELVGGLAAAALAPLAAQAQGRLPTIGFLGSSTQATTAERTAAFIRRLGELGWIEGRTVSIEYRWAAGRNERFTEIAAEFVRLKVDVIFTGGAGPVAAAKRATSTIPIVFGVASDPVASGLVASLASPGGNVTGMSYEGPDLAAKRLGLLRELDPPLVRLAVLANTGADGAMREMRQIRSIADAIGFTIVPLEIGRAEDIGPALAGLNARADALYVCADPTTNSNRDPIIARTLAERLPTMFGERENVEQGGLMSYGPSVPDLYRRAAEQVDKILRGAKPADIPVEQPTKFEMFVNLRTAKAIGINVPAAFLLRVDETIE